MSSTGRNILYLQGLIIYIKWQWLWLGPYKVTNKIWHRTLSSINYSTRCAIAFQHGLPISFSTSSIITHSWAHLIGPLTLLKPITFHYAFNISRTPQPATDSPGPWKRGSALLWCNSPNARWPDQASGAPLVIAPLVSHLERGSETWATVRRWGVGVWGG